VNPKTRRLVLILGAAVIIFSVVVAVILNRKPYSVLFTGMNQLETQEIAAKLQEMGEDYKIEKGDTILVLKDREDRLKAALVSEGYPKSGLTYDVFTSNIGMMSTDFERRQYAVMGLQDRMAAAIRYMPGVKDATVTFAVGEPQRYVLQDEMIETTASVLINMSNGTQPTTELVNGIQVLVSGGFPGLDKENVKVIDATNGREVTVKESTGEESSTRNQFELTDLKMRLEAQVAADSEQRVRRIFSQWYEADRVSVSANAVVDVDKKLKEIITYLPADNNRGVISQETWTSEAAKDQNEEGGVVGTESNSEVPVYPGLTTDGTEIFYENSGQIDYLVSQILEQIQSDASSVTDLRVSVAIDDRAPLPDEVLEVKRLIANAAGILAEHVDTRVALVYYSGSYTAGEPLPPQTSAREPVFLDFTLPELILIGAGIFIFLVIIVLVLVLVGNGRRKEAEEQAALDAAFGPDVLPDGAMLQLDGSVVRPDGTVIQPDGTIIQPDGSVIPPDEAMEPAEKRPDILDISLMDLPNTREQELKEQIGKFASENPEISAQLIRTWLRGLED